MFLDRLRIVFDWNVPTNTYMLIDTDRYRYRQIFLVTMRAHYSLVRGKKMKSAWSNKIKEISKNYPANITGKCDELKYLCSNHYTFYTYLYWTILTFTYTIFLSYLTVDKQLKHKLYFCLLSLYINVICTATIYGHIWR